MKFDSLAEKNIFYNIPVFLFSFLPIFLVTGPFLSDLSISLISIIFLFYCIKKKNFSFFKNKYFYFFLLFYLYLLFNSLINNFNLNSLKISFFFFRYGVFVTAIVYLLEYNNKFIKYFFYILFFSFTLLIFDGFTEYFTKKNFFGFQSIDYYRVSSLFKDELILGSYISRLWPLLFSLFILIFKSNLKIYYFIIFILAEALVFLSGERTAFLYLNFSAVFVIFFSKNLKKIRFVILIISSIIIILVSYLNPTAKERIIDQTVSQIKNNGEIVIFSQEHDQLYRTSYKMFLDNKIIGVGIKNFSKFCSTEKFKAGNLSCSTHPHNYYLQILAETGLLGALFILIVLFYFLKYLIIHSAALFKKDYYFSDVEISILSGIAIFLIPFVPTGSIFNNWVNITLCLYFPFLIYCRKLKFR